MSAYGLWTGQPVSCINVLWNAVKALYYSHMAQDQRRDQTQANNQQHTHMHTHKHLCSFNFSWDCVHLRVWIHDQLIQSYSRRIIKRVRYKWQKIVTLKVAIPGNPEEKFWIVKWKLCIWQLWLFRSRIYFFVSIFRFFSKNPEFMSHYSELFPDFQMYTLNSCSCGSEHCVSREHTDTKWIAWIHCKSLWIKASAKCNSDIFFLCILLRTKNCGGKQFP